MFSLLESEALLSSLVLRWEMLSPTPSFRPFQDPGGKAARNGPGREVSRCQLQHHLSWSLELAPQFPAVRLALETSDLPDLPDRVVNEYRSVMNIGCYSAVALSPSWVTCHHQIMETGRSSTLWAGADLTVMKTEGLLCRWV